MEAPVGELSRARLRPRLPLAAYGALAWLVACDIPTRFGAAGFSISGAATLLAGMLACAGAGWVVTARMNRERSTSRRWEPFLSVGLGHRYVPSPMVGFCLLALAWLTFSHEIEAIQNVCLYIAFPATVATVALASSAGTAFRVERLMWLATVGFLIIGAWSLGKEAAFAYGARSFALCALVVLAFLIPRAVSRIRFLVATGLLTVLVIASLSRTAALIAGLMLVGLAYQNGRRGWKLRIAFLLPAAVLGAQKFIGAYDPLRARFTGGDNAHVLGGIQLNTSGRTVLWRLTIDDARQSKWLGKGPGSASEYISANFSNIAHPHNEFIRLFHDFGLFGLVLYVAGFLLLLREVTIRAVRSRDPVHVSGAMAMGAVLLAAFTDNIFVYPHVMLPLGLLVGLSMAYPVTESASSSREDSVQS